MEPAGLTANSPALAFPCTAASFIVPAVPEASKTISAGIPRTNTDATAAGMKVTQRL